MHLIDNSNNKIRVGGVKRDSGGDEKQLLKFAWPYRDRPAFTDVAIYVYYIVDTYI